MSPTTLHLRSEIKPREERSALTPATTKALVNAGYKINVERSPGRIFKDEEFVEAGATLVAEGSWSTTPKEHLIIGLKELPEDDFPLEHTHIQFAHCFKDQSNWREVLSRFPRGGGTLYDLEFLTDDTGRRIAAFGYHAGYAGAAVAIMVWHWQLQNGKEPIPSLTSYENIGLLVEDMQARLKAGVEKSGRSPRVIVIGALGRSGKGALDLFRAIGIPNSNLLEWDMAETANGGPFPEIVESDIFINAIYLSESTPLFLDLTIVATPSRKLSVIGDVSCDPTSEFNPIKVYNACTTFSKPTVLVEVQNDPPLSVIAIDHLPSLLPRESSEAFSAQLLPHLLNVDKRSQDKVWLRAEKLFKEKAATL